jgi:sirohydrochlorin cobaltochelatase
VLAGHGSTRNPWSALPIYEKAQRIRELGIFREVHECFWKEEPNFHQVLRQVESRQVYVVPYFLAQGYFTQEVLPREMGLEGPITFRGEQRIFYCTPVGTHPKIEEVLEAQIRELIPGTVGDRERSSLALILVGHGTTMNEESGRAVRWWVERIRAKNRLCGECHGAFLDEPPRIERWWELTQKEAVLIVPFFVSQGLHTYQDIPRRLGIEAECPFGGPHRTRNREVWYAEPLGKDPGMVEVILALVSAADETHGTISRVA